MAEIKDYPDLLHDGKRSILPEAAQVATHNLGCAVRDFDVSSSLVTSFRDSLKGVSAVAFPRAAAEIRGIGRIYQGHVGSRSEDLLSKIIPTLKEPRSALETMLKATPDLGWFCLLHGNGYIRQEAVENLKAAPMSVFEFSAIVYRLNDWVRNVRFSAEQYARRNFPITSPDIVAQSSFFLLKQTRVFGRWEKPGQELLEEAIYRQDVLDVLKDQFMCLGIGRMGPTLQQILKRADFDEQLYDLAVDAKQPAIRAIAMEALLSLRVQWVAGYRKEWVDRVYGISRRVAEFDSRPIEPRYEFTELLRIAANDRSVQVRKIACDALIKNRRSADDAFNQIAESLKHDKSFTVRSRIDFYLRHHDEE